MTPHGSNRRRNNSDNLQVSALMGMAEADGQIQSNGGNGEPGEQLSALSGLLALTDALTDGSEVADTDKNETLPASDGVSVRKLDFALPSRDASTRRLAASLFREHPHLTARHRFRIIRYAHLVRLCERVAARLNQAGPFKADDDSKKALTDLARLSSEMRFLEDALGLVPAAAVADEQSGDSEGAYERIAARLTRMVTAFDVVPVTLRVQTTVAVSALAEPAERFDGLESKPGLPLIDERERRVRERIDALKRAADSHFGNGGDDD